MASLVFACRQLPWLGFDWFSLAWLGLAILTWLGFAWLSFAWRRLAFLACLRLAWIGFVGLASLRLSSLGLAWLGFAWLGFVLLDFVWLGLSPLGLAWLVLVWLRFVSLGFGWLCFAWLHYAWLQWPRQKSHFQAPKMRKFAHMKLGAVETCISLLGKSAFLGIKNEEIFLTLCWFHESAEISFSGG